RHRAKADTARAAGAAAGVRAFRPRGVHRAGERVPADRRARPGYDSGACADCVAGGRDPAPQPAAGPVAPAVGAVVDGGGSYGGTRAVTTAAFRVGPVCANRPSAAIAPRYALIGRWLHLHR